MAETGPQKYIAFRGQTEAVGNFITDFLAHHDNDRAPDPEVRRVFSEAVKKIQEVAPFSYRDDDEAGESLAYAYNNILTASEQAAFQAATGLS